MNQLDYSKTILNNALLQLILPSATFTMAKGKAV